MTPPDEPTLQSERDLLVTLNASLEIENGRLRRENDELKRTAKRRTAPRYCPSPN